MKEELKELLPRMDNEKKQKIYKALISVLDHQHKDEQVQVSSACFHR